MIYHYLFLLLSLWYGIGLIALSSNDTLFYIMGLGQILTLGIFLCLFKLNYLEQKLDKMIKHKGE